MLDFEETLQQQLNAAGVLATHEGLRQFDTDGSAITVGSVKLTSKGQLAKDYQTPYGTATVEQHVYQSLQGGATYCPLDRDARIIVSSTPKFAKMVSSKYAEFGSARVQHDLRDNHGRTAHPLFLIGPFTPLFTCPHRRPLPDDSVWVCMVCHAGATEYTFDPSAPQETRRQRRRGLYGAFRQPRIRLRFVS